MRGYKSSCKKEDTPHRNAMHYTRKSQILWHGAQLIKPSVGISDKSVAINRKT